MVIGIYTNPTKEHADEVVKQLVALLEEKSAQVYLDEAAAERIGRHDIGLSFHLFYRHTEIVFVLGGDGTLLGVARELAPYPILILGINLGNLGFLSEAEPYNLEKSVEHVLQKNYVVEKRMMLETCLYRHGTMTNTFHALNDVGIAKGSFSRMVTNRVSVNDMFLGQYSGDGVLVSSPTGSTAYSLSAGGPIISPHVQALLFTPIASHTLTARPIVLSAEDKIEIDVESEHLDQGLTIDGQLGVRLQPRDRIVVKRSSYTTHLIKWKENTFFEVVRQKLQGQPVKEGERIESQKAYENQGNHHIAGD